MILNITVAILAQAVFVWIRLIQTSFFGVMVYNHHARPFRHPPEVPYIDLTESLHRTYICVNLFPGIDSINAMIGEMVGLQKTEFPHPLAVIVQSKEMQIFFMMKFRSQRLSYGCYPMFPPGHRAIASQRTIVRNHKEVAIRRMWQIRRYGRQCGVLSASASTPPLSPLP